MIYKLPNATNTDMLLAEKLALEQHIAFFNINTPEREKKVKRIEEIERLLKGA